MAGNFQGWLISFGTVQLPNSFLLADGWESTPNQRLELDAYRDANVLLHRQTSSNYKTKMRLNIKGMRLEERMAFDNVIRLAELPKTERNERRVSVTYWNDETLKYASGVFYISDTTYTIRTVYEEQKDLEYKPFTLTLTEY